MSSETTIRAEQVSKAYTIYRRPEDRLKQMIFRKRQYFETYWALRDVSFEVKRGQTVGIIGRNGAGKSTLLQILCGTLAPTAGKVTRSGRIAALLELGAGFNMEFTGRENVYLSASILGLSRAEIDARLEDILSFASIGDFIDQPVKVYSSGMYARLAFAVAAHVDADVLIVDEILAVGDAAFNQKCMRFVHKFKANGTLLFVSHDPGSVVALCDGAIWLDGGTVRMSGPARDVCDAYSVSLKVEADTGASLKFGGRRAQAPDTAQGKDHRLDILKSSPLRNEIQVFDFNPETSWHGERKADIQKVDLLASDGGPLAALEGGEEVMLVVTAHAAQDLDRPIVGFQVMNRHGLVVFAENTYLTYADRPVRARAGQSIKARFRFQLPFLPTGDYGITIALADGTQAEAVQQHWLDDAMFFRVTSSHVVRGLCGVPMLNIELETGH